MITIPKGCAPRARLLACLHGRLSDVEEAELQLHLGDCVTCRREIEEAAAEAAFWNEAGQFLGSEPCQPSRDEPLDLRDESGRQTPQTRQVIDSLGPTDDPDSLGRIGGYEVTGIVGAGGMGVVLKAHDRALDRVVAIKVMAPHLAESGSARKRFAREAKAAAAVIHPNVIPVYGVSNADPLPYLVMPYVGGTSLQRRLDKEGPLTTVEVLRVGSQVAAGLSAAHGQGLVHRDIKPANIMLNHGVERVSITDFGLARAADDASMTRTGVIAGTPQYMSPEQARGGPIDHRSDLFSLGSVLYAACTGRPPFRAESSYGVSRRITDDDPEPIRSINPEIPEWLCQIISKLMQKLPEQRFDSAAQVAKLLDDCLAHVQQPITTPLPRGVESPVAPNGRRPPIVKLVAGAFFAFLLTLAGGLIVLESNRGTISIENNTASAVPIQIARSNQVVERLTVTKEGAKTRLSAGEYVITLDSPDSDFEIAGDQVVLKRGSEWVAKIVVSGQPLSGVPANDRGAPSPNAAASVAGKIAPGDTLAVVIRGVLPANTDLRVAASPPIFESSGGSKFTGFPLRVADDGTIRVPFMEPIGIAGMSVREAEAAIEKQYVDREITGPNLAGVMLTPVTRGQGTPSRIRPGDTLAVYLPGILPADKNSQPPINRVASGAFVTGYPLEVAEDGTLNLPLIAPLKIGGYTIREAEAEIAKAYLESRILSPRHPFPILTRID